jgi:hypothetical protein
MMRNLRALLSFLIEGAGFTESYWMVSATINYRDTPSQIAIP